LPQNVGYCVPAQIDVERLCRAQGHEREWEARGQRVVLRKTELARIFANECESWIGDGFVRVSRVYSRLSPSSCSQNLEGAPMKLTLRERFLAKVCREVPSRCWLWQGMIRPDGFALPDLSPEKHPRHPDAATQSTPKLFNLKD